MTLEPISKTEMRPVRYLFEPYVPRAKFTDLAGRMGSGKSLLTVHWAAAVSTGKANLPEPASVLMFAIEDDLADTIRPRLEAAGADTDRIYSLKDDALDRDTIAGYCEAAGDVALITVDPITGFLPAGVDAWKTPAVRHFLRPLIDLAQERDFALVGVQHVNRSGSSDPLARIADAQGFPQVARSVLVWGPDPDDPEQERGSRKVLASAKLNLVKGSHSESYRIEGAQVTSEINVPRLVHEGVSQHQAHELLHDHSQPPAEKFLEEALADGPRTAKALEDEAAQQRISEHQLRRAREHVGAETHKRSDGQWEWSIPIEAPF